MKATTTITEEQVLGTLVAAERFQREIDLLGTQVAAADPISAYLTSIRAGHKLVLTSLQDLQAAARIAEAQRAA